MNAKTRRVSTLTHWGAYNIEITDRSIRAAHPFEPDPAPSPIGHSFVDAIDHRSRIREPAIRKSWLEHGAIERSGRRGHDSFISVSWETALELVASELDRVRNQYGNESIFGGSYGWSSAGRFHHGQSQIHRFLNQLGGYTFAKTSYSFAAAEIIINIHKYAYKKEIITIRGNNVYGIRQYPEKLIPRCIISLLKGKKIPIHGKGNNIRHYLSAKDFARAVCLLAKKKHKGIYNVGSQESYSNIYIAKTICRILNKNPKKFIKFIKDRPYNDRRYSISTQKINKLGWEPEYKLKNELLNIIQWYKKNIKLFKNFKL